jgi:hypothetical protein
MITKEEINELPDVSNAREPMIAQVGRLYVLKNKGAFEIFDPGNLHKMNYYNPLIFKHYKPVGHCLTPEAALAVLSLLS